VGCAPCRAAAGASKKGRSNDARNLLPLPRLVERLGTASFLSARAFGVVLLLLFSRLGRVRLGRVFLLELHEHTQAHACEIVVQHVCLISACVRVAKKGGVRVTFARAQNLKMTRKSLRGCSVARACFERV